MPEQVPRKEIIGRPRPEEVEELSRKIREGRGSEITFPKETESLESVTEEPLAVEKPEIPLPEAEFKEIETGPKKLRYAEGDPVVFDRAIKDQEFLKWLIEKTDVSKINFQNPGPKETAEIVRLYESYENEQKS